MAQDKSVSASLSRLEQLMPDTLTGAEVVISGETHAIIAKRAGTGAKAWLNACPHQGRSLDYVPGKFLIDKGLLVCPAHGATFELDEGLCVAGPCRGEHLRAIAVYAEADGTLRFGPL